MFSGRKAVEKLRSSNFLKPNAEVMDPTVTV